MARAKGSNQSKFRTKFKKIFMPMLCPLFPGPRPFAKRALNRDRNTGIGKDAHGVKNLVTV